MHSTHTSISAECRTLYTCQHMYHAEHWNVIVKGKRHQNVQNVQRHVLRWNFCVRLLSISFAFIWLLHCSYVNFDPHSRKFVVQWKIRFWFQLVFFAYMLIHFASVIPFRHQQCEHFELHNALTAVDQCHRFFEATYCSKKKSRALNFANM